MTQKQSPLAQQVLELQEQITLLNQRVAQLEAKAPATAPIARIPPKVAVTTEAEKPVELMLLASSSSLLQHVSTLCFLLVAALGLRALTDNGLLNLNIGTIIGICYAAALIFSGHLFYRKNSTLAPIFSTTGALLMFSILVETYVRFASIPMVVLYIMLATTGVGMALISYANNAALPIIVGTLGMCLAGVTIDYPNPFFPFLGLLLWLANILAYFATRIKRCSWLRWTVMFITHFMLQIWGIKLSGNFFGADGSSRNLAPEWFIPVVVLIGLTFMLISLFGIIRSGDEKISRFDFSLPALNAGWCYVAAVFAMKSPATFATPAAIAAIVHFGIAAWLASRVRRNAPGTNTFVSGGVILSCLSLPAMFDSMLNPLPLLSVVAFGIAYFSRRWFSGGMRITATFLQAYICLTLVYALLNNDRPENPWLFIIITALCSLLALFQYRFQRRHLPPKHSLFYTRIDKQDLSTITVLLSSLICAYVTLSATSKQILITHYQGDFNTAFMSTQSVIINGAAFLLMIIAIKKRNKELLNVSVLVTLIGGCKVFLIDMIQISGIWLVVSIFVFAITAFVESVALSSWQSQTNSLKKPERPDASAHDSDKKSELVT